MAISGLVLAVAEGASGEAALRALRADPRLTLGEHFGRRVAAVAETASVESDRMLWEELHALPGIVGVDVTFVHLDPVAGCGGEAVGADVEGSGSRSRRTASEVHRTQVSHSSQGAAGLRHEEAFHAHD